MTATKKDFAEINRISEKYNPTVSRGYGVLNLFDNLAYRTKTERENIVVKRPPNPWSTRAKALVLPEPGS